ncbi:MAG TPA: hypothetical protein VK636_10575 [Gemmatimonadaceae bacterium]|nr:hypothetical protein [Gemmatimonadaceae bacterium]
MTVIQEVAATAATLGGWAEVHAFGTAAKAGMERQPTSTGASWPVTISTFADRMQRELQTEPAEQLLARYEEWKERS